MLNYQSVSYDLGWLKYVPIVLKEMQGFIKNYPSRILLEK